MALGDMSLWKDRFHSVDEKFMSHIVKHWPNCIASLSPSTIEDDVTYNLVHRLCKDPEVRRLGWPDTQYVPLELIENSTAVTSKGYIDMALILDGDRDKYVAYECKRLNVTYQSGKQSLAKPYVEEGLYRYIYQQYSSSLPMGCMLGYVMDGDIKFALTSVHTAIKKHVAGDKLKSGPTDMDKIGTSARFQTTHKRTDGSHFEVNHAFLSF